jgi:hypothetical protein
MRSRGTSEHNCEVAQKGIGQEIAKMLRVAPPLPAGTDPENTPADLR